MYELLEADKILDTFATEHDCDQISEEPMVNFEKFHDMFMIISELEHFRMTSYQGPKFGDKESQTSLVNHIQSVVSFEGDSPTSAPESWTKKIGDFMTGAAKKKRNSESTSEL